jgi:hypothetical protein
MLRQSRIDATGDDQCQLPEYLLFPGIRHRPPPSDTGLRYLNCPSSTLLMKISSMIRSSFFEAHLFPVAPHRLSANRRTLAISKSEVDPAFLLAYARA